MRDERNANLLWKARHGVDHARWESRFGKQLDKGEGRRRRVLGRLDDDGIAGGQERGQLPRQQHKRRVPRRDRGNDTDRFAPREGEHPRLVDREHRALDLVRQTAEIAEPFRNISQLGAHLGDELAVVARLQRRQPVRIRGDQIRQTDKQRPARGGRQAPLGLPPTVAEIISVPLVAAFGKSHPTAVLRLVSAYTGYLLDWLHRGEIDLAGLYDPRAARSLRSRPLVLENLFLIGPADVHFSTVRAIPFKEFDGKRLLLPSLRHGLRTIVERCAVEAGISLDVVVEADSYATLKDLVRHGHGWTILPLASIHEDVVGRKLTAAPLIDPVPSRRLVLSFPADRPTPRIARFAGQAIIDIVTDQVERAVWVGQLLDGKSDKS